MKVAIMQPYLFPYYLYWKLIKEVDVFVIYDNVNFKKRGFINRNYSFHSGTKKRFTLSLQKASQNKLINEINICQNQDELKCFLKRHYERCRNFDDAWPIFDKILSQDDLNLAVFLENSIKILCNYLCIRTKIISASSLKSEQYNLKGQDRILYLCKLLGANQYLNLPGGKNLYDVKDFKNNNIELDFLSPVTDELINIKVDNFQECSIVDLIMTASNSSLIDFFSKHK